MEEQIKTIENLKTSDVVIKDRDTLAMSAAPKSFY